MTDQSSNQSLLLLSSNGKESHKLNGQHKFNLPQIEQQEPHNSMLCPVGFVGMKTFQDKY